MQKLYLCKKEIVMGKHIRFDWAMKRLLRNKANFDVLEGFLTELLEFDVIICEILESEGNKEDQDDKFNRVDILVKNSSNELILIEVQNERENDFFHRMNYGQANLLTEGLDEGDNYDQIKRIYSINIVYFNLGRGTDYIYVGKTEFKGMHTNDILELSPAQKKNYPITEVSDIFTKYYVLKVNNFEKVAEAGIDEWIYFLKNNEIKDEFEAKGLPEAKEKLRVSNLNSSDKLKYDNFVKIKRIRENELESAKQHGHQKAEDKYLHKLEQERKEKEEAKAREKQAKAREEEAKARAEKERKAKEEANKTLRNAIINIAKNGTSSSQIALMFNIPESEVVEILKSKQ